MSIVIEGASSIVEGVPHLTDISLELQPGRLHVLLGRTLSGKTSLLRLIAGLDRPTRGRVLANGKDTVKVPVNKRRVAFVYQQFINYPSFTVYDNIAAPLRRAGLARAEIDRRVRETARILHIDHLLERLPVALSGGQQQRVAIARALVKDAEVLLLDEPLVNLDYKLREELRTELRAIFRQSERIVVYTTTEPTEALQLGGHTAVLYEGRLLQFGETPRLYRAPGSVQVAEVFSDPPMNIVPARVAGGRLDFAGQSVPLPPQMAGVAEGPARIGVRPSHLSMGGGEAGDGGLVLSGEVTLSEVNGSETFVHVAAAGSHWVLQLDGVHVLHNGAALSLRLDPALFYLFGDDGGLLATPRGSAATASMEPA